MAKVIDNEKWIILSILEAIYLRLVEIIHHIYLTYQAVGGVVSLEAYKQ